MKIFNVIPQKSVNKIEFGMNRKEVRNMLNRDFTEFKKSKFSKNTTDDFGTFHVFYNTEDKCEAIEIFEGAEIFLNQNQIMPSTITYIKECIEDLISEDGSYISKKHSIGIYAPKDNVESILFADKEYYS